MRAKPQRPPLPVPQARLALMRAESCTLSFYRYLYAAVGERWLWFVRRGWSDHDVAALLSLGAQVAVEHILHRVHGLRTAAEGQNRRIRLRRIVSVGKNHLISDRGASYLFGLLQQLRMGGLHRDRRNAEYNRKHRYPLQS